MSDYISDELRAKAGRLRDSIAAPAPRLPGWSPPRMSAQEAAEARATRKAAAEQAQAAAFTEWQQLHARIPETREGLTLRAVLDVHKPRLDVIYGYFNAPACDHCDQIGGYEREGVPWPCETYEVVKEGMG